MSPHPVQDICAIPIQRNLKTLEFTDAQTSDLEQPQRHRTPGFFRIANANITFFQNDKADGSRSHEACFGPIGGTT
jgi:hypothetical protein